MRGENFESSIKDKNINTPDFDFTAKEVLSTLRSSTEHGLEYLGNATSDFQAQPLLYGPDGQPVIMSDWEFEVAKEITDGSGKIKGAEQPADFPRWHEKKEGYFNRSQELGENMVRFSLDFGRLCPQVNEFNHELMADYVKALGLIKARGMEPMLTIYHWPMPKYLIKYDAQGEINAGGWEHPEVAKHFKFYTENVIKFLTDEDKVRQALHEENFDKAAQDKFLAEGLVRYFLTINEPRSILLDGYWAGIFPPYKKGRVDLYRQVMTKLVEAHDIALDQIKQGKFKLPPSQETKVGATYNWDYFEGALGNIFHKLINEYPTDSIERNGLHSDFLGLDYYCRVAAPSLSPPLGPFKPKGRHYGDHPGFGDVYPQGIYKMLKKMNERYPQKEIFVTEFGFSDKKDKRRPYWILETVRYVIEALKNKIPVRGMLHWSLVNNFEWNLGISQKFGLFDESELKQELKDSPVGQIKGWEAWRAVIKAIKNPSPETLQELQNYYQTAKEQFAENVK